MMQSIRAYIRKRQYDKAIAACVEALASNPDDPEVLYLLAVAQYSIDDYESAATTLTRLIEHDPENTDALLLLALVSAWDYGNAYRAAQDLYRKVIQLNDAEVEGYVGLPLTRRLPGVRMTISESIELLERALALDPDRWQVHNNLGYAYWEAGDFTKARQLFEEVLRTAGPDLAADIRNSLERIKARKPPRSTAYLGPRVPRLPEAATSE